MTVQTAHLASAEEEQAADSHTMSRGLSDSLRAELFHRVLHCATITMLK
jgi:hypothetical protein